MNLTHIPQPGDVIDRKYILDRMLGKGGFGIVFEAKHTNLPGQRNAIKFLLERQLNDTEERERFRREAHVGTVLRSGRNVQVIDAGEFFRFPTAPGLPYIVMEFLEGNDLDAYVGTHGVLGVHTAVDFILQACIALAEAHGRGIYHRDIKPANLFLTSHLGAPYIKVLDFGLAKSNGGPVGVPKTTTGIIMLSVGYAPPEQQKGLKLADALSDIFSLAATLYFLLTGSRPFAGDDIHDIMVAVARDAPMPMGHFRPDVPNALVDVIHRALEKEPSARPKSVVEFAHLLVPFGSAEAMRIFGDVQRAALLGGPSADSGQGGGTVKMPPPLVASIDPPTVRQPPPTPAPIGAPVNPPAPPTVPFTPRPGSIPPTTPRQTPWLIVGLVFVVVAVVATLIALWIGRADDSQVAQQPPSASAEKNPGPPPTTPESATPIPPPSSTTVPPPSSTPPPPPPPKKPTAPLTKPTASSKFSKKT